jgi:hypothetical protein
MSFLAGAVATPGKALGQASERWNDDRVLELVRRARLLRRSAVVDSTFRSYRADARGYVYFFIDRPDSEERTLVKADQIALEIAWGAPNRTTQRIVGLRDEKLLPTNIRYHLDHLTVVQDDFGDRIRIGDGDEVSEVLHPMAPGGPTVYDYSLSDSLSIRYGGADEEVRVYEVRVRPKDPAEPAFVGSVYVDRANAAIVRMRFTFTPASYVDPYLDYIRISLDNSLWESRHWLPYRQQVELRRELPQLDFLAGSVIRGRFEIDGYAFNVELPDASFPPYRVTAAPEAEREAFAFERGLFDDLEEEGLSTPPSLDEVRERAREILRGRALSGLAPFRLHVRSVSDVVRYNRAEGLFMGAGLRVRPGSSSGARFAAGYAFSRKRPSLSLTASGPPLRVVPVIEAYWDELRDIGPLPATAPLLGSLGGMFFDEDFLDPFFARGGRLALRGPRPGAGAEIGLRLERHRSGTLTVDGDFRPILPVEKGVLAALEVATPVPLPLGGRGNAAASAAALGGRRFATLRGSGQWELGPVGARLRGVLRWDAGIVSGQAPPQARFLMGGAGTLPGYDLRAFQGRGFWLLRLEGTRALIGPWFGLRAFAAVGATHLADVDRLPPGWTAGDTDGPLTSLGAGISIGWDVLRLDFARGLRHGRWEAILSVEPRFQPFL